MTPAGGEAVGPSRPRRWLTLAIKAAVSVGLIALILSRVRLRDVLDAMLAADPTLLAIAFSLTLVGNLITSMRWRALLAAHGLEMGIPLLFRSLLVGVFVRQFLPSTFSGDAVRIYDSWRAGASKSVALAVVGVDRLLGLLTLSLFALAGLVAAEPLTRNIPMLGLWVGLAAAGLLTGVFAIFSRRGGILRLLRRIAEVLPEAISRLATRLLDALAAFHGHRAALAKALALSFLLQLNVVLFYFLLARAMDFGIEFARFFLIVPVAIFVMMLPISINGIGLREGIFVVLLGALGVGVQSAIAYAWLEFCLFLLQGTLGGVVFVLRR